MDSVSNISNIVNSALSKMKFYGYGQKDYAWLENIAIRFYQDKLRGFNMPSIRVEKFPVTLATRVWTFPSDFMAYTKIAYKLHGTNGISVLGLNTDMNISGDIASCAEPTPTTGSSNGVFFADGGWGYGQFNYATPYYAMGGGFADNYYRPDFEHGCIRFLDALPVGDAFIEYLSTGKDVSGETLVPPAYRGAFEDYLSWQCCLRKPALLNIAPVFEKDFRASMWDSNILAKGMTTQEMMDIIWKASGFTLR